MVFCWPQCRNSVLKNLSNCSRTFIYLWLILNSKISKSKIRMIKLYLSKKSLHFISLHFKKTWRLFWPQVRHLFSNTMVRYLGLREVLCYHSTFSLSNSLGSFYFNNIWSSFLLYQLQNWLCVGDVITSAVWVKVGRGSTSFWAQETTIKFLEKQRKSISLKQKIHSKTGLKVSMMGMPLNLYKLDIVP